MRVLHPIAMQERFIASGTYYTYRLEEDSVQEMGTREHFTLHELQGGAHLLRVDVDGREAKRPSILAEALLSPDGIVERHTAQRQPYLPADGPVSQIDVIREGDSVSITRREGQGERQRYEIPLPEGTAILPASNVGYGFALRRLRAGATQVFSPLRPLRQGEVFFAAQILATQDETVILGEKHHATQRVTLLEGDEEQTLWVDAHGIVLQRLSEEAQIQIHDYAHA